MKNIYFWMLTLFCSTLMFSGTNNFTFETQTKGWSMFQTRAFGPDTAFKYDGNFNHVFYANTAATIADPYCTPEGTNSARYINNFSTTGGSTNITNEASGFSTGGYGDFSSMSVTQGLGGSVNFTANVEGGTAGFRIWVDWNQDGEFDTSTEVAYASNAYLSNHEGSFTVPASALTGQTTMRIVSHWLSTSGDVDPCATGFTYGEFEDYTFNVTTEAVWDCPNHQANIGDACDDGNPDTLNDAVNENCECEGIIPPDGMVCEAPIEITALPYTTTDNTENYGDDYESSNIPPLAEGAVGNPSSYYLTGDDVVYAYTPSQDQIIDITITNHGSWAGVFVFTGCSPFTSTVGGHTSSSGTEDLKVHDLLVEAGVTYYIVISTNATPQTTPYTLSIIDVTPSCFIPTDVAIDNITQTSAELSWTTSASQSDIYLVLAGEPAPDENSTPTHSDLTSPSTLNNLTNSTNYDVYLRSDCGINDGVSDWVGPLTFATSCGIATVPYVMDFETATVPNLPACTSRENNGIGNDWNTRTSATGFNGKVLNYSYHFTPGTANSWFYTQGIQLYANTTYDLSFLVGNNSTTYTESMKVSYGTSPTESAMVNEITDLPSIQTSSSAPMERLHSVNPPSDGVYYFGFNVYSIDDQNQLYLDDISIVEAPECPNPSNLSVSNIGETSVELEWDHPGANYYNIIVREADGEEYTPTQGDITDADIEGQPYTKTGLSPNTTYEFYVIADCDMYWSGFVGPFTFTTLAVAPDNDDACGATTLACGDSIEQSLAGATESLEDSCFGSGTSDVWFTFTSDGSQTMTVAETSNFDAIVQLFVGDDCGNLVEAGACSDYTENYTVTEAGTYYFRVRPYSSSNNAGTIVVGLTCTTPPVNDNCDGAIALECGDDPITISSIGSTATAPEGCSLGSNGIWFSFEGTGADITINSTADFDHEMSVHTGSCNELISIACIDDSIGAESYTIESTVANQMYYVYVAHYSSTGTTTGDITISIECAVVPECTSPELTLEAQDAAGEALECVESDGEYYVLATLSGGEGNDTYNLTDGEFMTTVLADGNHLFGPYDASSTVNITATGMEDNDCSVSQSISSPDICPEIFYVSCDQPLLDQTYCYGHNDLVEWLFTNPSGEPLQISFSAGTLEGNSFSGGTWDDLIIYDGTNADGIVLFNSDDLPGNSRQDLTGLSFVAESGSLFIWFESDFSTSCSNNDTIHPWVYTVSCVETFDCPTFGANIGDACDDGDDMTENDTINEDCECVGTPIIVWDCPELEANIGDACDDGDETTENDVVTEDCECAGTPIIVEPEFDCPNLEANIGDSCDDGDETTENDVVTEDCECAGTPIIVEPEFDCPNLEANIGDSCDDGNDMTENDVVTEDCECMGTPIEQNDMDGDGIPDDIDNCPSVYNPDQADGNGDGIGDACEECDLPYMVELARTSPTTATFNAGNSVWHYQGSANRAGRPLRPYPMYGMNDMTVPHTQYALVPAFEYDVWLRTICDDGSFSPWAGPYFIPTFETGARRTPRMDITPNPAIAIVKISKVEAKTIEVFDMNGGHVKTFNTNDNQFDMTGLPTGKYNLRVIDAEGNIHYDQVIKK